MCPDLWKEVEQLQIKLQDTVSKNGVSSPETIRVSRLFRDKMAEYKRCSNNR